MMKRLTNNFVSHCNTKPTTLLLLLLFTATIAFAHANDLFKKANDFYAQGNYAAAIENYEALLEQDHIAAAVYYNLGNCYYKTDQLPNAILHYEKALKLQPNHEDALYNLAMANKLTIDKIERMPTLFIESTWQNLVTSKTVDSWAYHTVGFVFLSLVLLVAYLLAQNVILKKIGFYAGLLVLGLGLFTLLMAKQHQSIIEQTSEAIIFSPSIPIQSAPNENSETLFTLHEGTKVTQLEKNGDWSKIKLPNGHVGWIKSEAIEGI